MFLSKHIKIHPTLKSCGLSFDFIVNLWSGRDGEKLQSAFDKIDDAIDNIKLFLIHTEETSNK
jgi:hypothetical protein